MLICHCRRIFNKTRGLEDEVIKSRNFQIHIGIGIDLQYLLAYPEHSSDVLPSKSVTGCQRLTMNTDEKGKDHGNTPSLAIFSLLP